MTGDVVREAELQAARLLLAKMGISPDGLIAVVSPPARVPTFSEYAHDLAQLHRIRLIGHHPMMAARLVAAIITPREAPAMRHHVIGREVCGCCDRRRRQRRAVELPFR